MDEMIYYDQITQSLSESLHYGSSTLADIPKLVKQVLEQKMWQKRTVRATGRVVEFKYFADYVTAREPEGLGGNIGQLRAICRDEPAVLELIDLAIQKSPGNPTGNNGNGVNHPISEPRDRSTKQLRRLRKDFRELHTQVMNKEKKVYEAAVEAGIVPRRTSISLKSSASAAETIINSGGSEYARDVANELLERLSK